MEINLQPALGTRTPLDLELKRELVRDLFDLAEIRVAGASPAKANVKGKASEAESGPVAQCGGFRLIYSSGDKVGEAVSRGGEKSEL